MSKATVFKSVFSLTVLSVLSFSALAKADCAKVGKEQCEKFDQTTALFKECCDKSKDLGETPVKNCENKTGATYKKDEPDTSEVKAKDAKDSKDAGSLTKEPKT